MLHLLGIRHHGPGSAKAVLQALEANLPDCLLVEIPADADGLLQFMTKTQPEISAGKNEETPPPATLTPPIAMLIYDPKDLNKASYLPFASFSPEWIAVQFALERNIPIRFMDLPMEMNFALDELEQENKQTVLFTPEGAEKMTPEL